MPGKEKPVLNSAVRQLWEGSVGAGSPGWRTRGEGTGKVEVCGRDNTPGSSGRCRAWGDLN